jgi:hypothetical protein
MTKRYGFIVGALAIFLITGYVYLVTRTPPGITPQDGETSEAIAWISLAVASISLLAAVVGLIQKFIELRATPRS